MVAKFSAGLQASRVFQPKRVPRRLNYSVERIRQGVLIEGIFANFIR